MGRILLALVHRDQSAAYHPTRYKMPAVPGLRSLSMVVRVVEMNRTKNRKTDNMGTMA